eukprot:4202389-Heterocapsa_arctica.AAC.1
MYFKQCKIEAQSLISGLEKEKLRQDGEDPGPDLRVARWPNALPEWGPGAAGTNNQNNKTT